MLEWGGGIKGKLICIYHLRCRWLRYMVGRDHLGCNPPNGLHPDISKESVSNSPHARCIVDESSPFCQLILIQICFSHLTFPQGIKNLSDRLNTGLGIWNGTSADQQFCPLPIRVGL